MSWSRFYEVAEEKWYRAFVLLGGKLAWDLVPYREMVDLVD